MKKILYYLALALVTLSSCQDPNDGEMFVVPTDIESEMTATTILERSPEEYSLWIELLKHADYYNALKNPDTKATVFCPNNDAIYKFLQAKGYSSVADIPVDYAKQVVQIHIIKDKLKTDTEIDQLANTDTTHVNSTDMSETTLFGTALSLNYGYKITDVDDAEREPDWVVHNADSIYINNQARLAKFTAVVSSNANLFTMGDVILPNTETIMDKLDQTEEYSIFASAVHDCGMDSIASKTCDETTTTQQSNAVTRRYTCFAVPDNVYRAAGISDLNGLKAWLASNCQGDDAQLLNYVKYHFMTREYTKAELYDTMKIGQTVIFDTQYNGQVICADQDESRTCLLNKSINIIRSNISTRNGNIHKIDQVMPVYHPAKVTVNWDFLDAADIIAFVNNWGADNNLANFFTRPMESSEKKIDLSGEHKDGDYGEITSFTYEANETRSATNTYRRVGYMKDAFTSSTNRTTPKHNCYMNNYLVLNLGFAGWIEFTTPAIIAGNYQVKLHYIKDITLASIYNKGTAVEFKLDGMQTTKALYKGEKKTQPFYDSIEMELWKKVNFETSGTHTLRMTMRDMEAKNNSSYHLRLDYVEFIPIED